jgi:hypothetical protein
MNLSKHFNKDALHHAYLIEGAREEVLPEVLAFIESLGVSTIANPDFYHMSFDSFKVEDARDLKSFGIDKNFSPKKDAKRVFLISANNFLLEAQNTMLKMFEEPLENTHYFLILLDADTLLKTFRSRFYFISATQRLKDELKEAEKFIALPLGKRLDFIKELLVEPEEEEIILIDSARPKAIKFLNALETVLHKKRKNYNVSTFKQIFKAREFLRMPGSSAKSLMESVALVIPVLQ